MATLIRYELTHPRGSAARKTARRRCGMGRLLLYEDVIIEPWENQKINIRLRVEIPKGYYVQTAC